MAAQIVRYTAPGGGTDACADCLDRREQRKAEQHRPCHAIAKLCTDLAVSADARWIIVGCTGYKTGAEHV
jgi:hypothetical protein